MILSLSVFGKNYSAEESIKDISLRLASINQKLASIHGIQNEMVASALSGESSGKRTKKSHNTDKGAIESIFNTVLSEAYDLKRKYNDNPYVKITGFDINLGLMIPSFTVNIEFK